MNLENAVRSADLPAAQESLRAGENPNQAGPEGLTPLMIASGLGQLQMVELLLTAGAAVHAIEARMGATALHKAVQSGNVDVVALLLDQGAFIDQQSPVLGNTPLMDAVLNKHEGVVALLLDRGARTPVTNHWQQTALDLTHDDQLDSIALLIEQRLSGDAERIRALALIAAVKAGAISTVEQLIAAGADVNQRTPVIGSSDDDYTPLGIASRERHIDIVKVLLDAGADPRRVIGLMRGTPLHDASYFGHADVIRLLTVGGARADSLAVEINAQGPYNGLTALHDAVWHGHTEAARALVEAGARLDLKTHAGLTPLGLAVLYGYDDIARLLAGEL